MAPVDHNDYDLNPDRTPQVSLQHVIVPGNILPDVDAVVRRNAEALRNRGAAKIIHADFLSSAAIKPSGG